MTAPDPLLPPEVVVERLRRPVDGQLDLTGAEQSTEWAELVAAAVDLDELDERPGRAS